MTSTRSHGERLLEEDFPRVLSLLILSYLEVKEIHVRTWGKRGKEAGEFNFPDGVSVLHSANEIAIADSFNNRIQVFSSEGKFLCMWGARGSKAGEVNFPYGIASLSANEVIIADTCNYRIQVFTPKGQFLRMWGAKGEGAGEFNFPYGIAVLPCASRSSSEIFISDTINCCIQVFTPEGKFLRMWGKKGRGAGEFYHPYGIALLPCASRSSYEVAVADSGNHRIQVFSTQGKLLRMWGNEGAKRGEFQNPYGIASLPSGEVVVTDKYNNRVQVFTSEGKFLRMLESYGDHGERFHHPQGVAALSDSSGEVIIVDGDNHRFHVFRTVFE